MAINNSRTRFAVGSDSLDIILRNGKSGIAVFARTKASGFRAVIGAREVHADETKAQAHFDALVADAEKTGWVKRSSGSGGVTASKFTTIPAPGSLPASTPLTGKPGKAAPAPAASPAPAGKGKGQPGKK